MSDLVKEITNISSHRNGIAGNPFLVITFTSDVSDGEMLAIIFHGECRCAILSIDELTKGNIKFAEGNSWRGDQFFYELMQHMKEDYPNYYDWYSLEY